MHVQQLGCQVCSSDQSQSLAVWKPVYKDSFYSLYNVFSLTFHLNTLPSLLLHPSFLPFFLPFFLISLLACLVPSYHPPNTLPFICLFVHSFFHAFFMNHLSILLFLCSSNFLAYLPSLHSSSFKYFLFFKRLYALYNTYMYQTRNTKVKLLGDGEGRKGMIRGTFDR